MKLLRPSRVIAAIITIFSLLFTQLALASYLCPELGTAKPVMMVDDRAPMADCANMTMPKEPSGLCHSHCQAGKQSADTPPVPLVQPFVAAQLSVVLRVAGEVAPPHAVLAAGVCLKRSTSPPLAIQNCCFRI